MASNFPGGNDAIPDIVNPTVTLRNAAPTLSTRVNTTNDGLAAVQNWLNAGLYEPHGVVKLFAGTVAPTGYLLCDGSAVSRTTFSTLFTAIGTTWGAGDGSTTFNVPDTRGRAPIGVGAATGTTSARALAASGGQETHVLVDAELSSHSHTLPNPQHTHVISDPGHLHSVSAFTATIQGLQTGGAQYFFPGTVNTSTATTGVFSQPATTGLTVTNITGTDTAHNNMQPFVAFTFIIKT